MQGIRREGDEPGFRQSSRHILDVWVQTPILVHHQNHRCLSVQRSRRHQITPPLPMAARRRKGGVTGLDVGVIKRYLFGIRIIRHQSGQQHSHGESGFCEGRQAGHERTTVDDAVGIFVIPIKSLLGNGQSRRGFWIRCHRDHVFLVPGCVGQFYAVVRRDSRVGSAGCQFRVRLQGSPGYGTRSPVVL